MRYARLTALVLALPCYAAAQASSDSLGARGQALFAAKDYRGAARVYAELVRIDSTKPRNWYYLGTSRQLSGDIAGAEPAYRRAIAAGAAIPALYNLSSLFASTGRLDSAAAWLHKAIQAGYTNSAAIESDPDFAGLVKDSRYSVLKQEMRVAAAPCMARPESRKFDFWVGEWDVTTPAGQPAGTSSVQLLLEGCTLFENWHSLAGSDGKSLSSYNAGVGVWQQFWTDQTGRVTEYRASEWVGDTLRFTAHSTAPQGPVVLVMSFAKIDANTVRQWGAVSIDDGKTWSSPWDLYYHRKHA